MTERKGKVYISTMIAPSFEDDMETAFKHIEVGDIFFISRLVTRNPSALTQTFCGRSLLHVACESRDYSIVNFLVEFGTDVNTRTAAGQTPLHITARTNNVDILNLLLTVGADISVLDELSYTALHVACENGSSECASTLVSMMSDEELAYHTLTGFSPLHLASAAGLANIVQMLCDYHVPLIVRDNQGLTALHHACKMGFIDVAMILIQNGHHIDYIDKQSRRPFSYISNAKDLATLERQYRYVCIHVN